MNINTLICCDRDTWNGKSQEVADKAAQKLLKMTVDFAQNLYPEATVNGEVIDESYSNSNDHDDTYDDGIEIEGIDEESGHVIYRTIHDFINANWKTVLNSVS